MGTVSIWGLCPYGDWFSSYKICDGGLILFGNNKACKVTSIRSIKLKLSDGVERTLQDVIHVPELKRNLISIGMLDAQGYCCKVESGVLKVLKRSLVVMKGRLKNGLYLLDGNTMVREAATISDTYQRLSYGT
ncbi:hypothetical protein Pfo_001530 [Paulownia fortunei]|nr:hypothetical protein Pfo_001530 [Paulownia fortunei]